MWKEIRDQLAHVAFAFLILAWTTAGPIGWIIAGGLCGMIREVTEEGKPVTPAKIVYAFKVSKRDVAFWAVGGGLAWLALQ